MATRRGQDVSRTMQEKILSTLEECYAEAERNFTEENWSGYRINENLASSLKNLSNLSPKASTGFTNIMTCLAIKAAFEHIDVRYHQVQIQHLSDRPAGFNFRGVSEKLVAPWLSDKTFEGAKSGWQTRTFERPKPYMLDYEENIGDIKYPFLQVFNELEENGESARDALTYIIHLQLIHRESKKIVLSRPLTDDIHLIVEILRQHFFHRYRASKGASRLPVLALFAVYQVLVEQLDRFNGMQLKPLEEHSAADSQTGAVGDIEIVDAEGNVFEAIEVKHGVPLDEVIIQDVAGKIMDKSVDRYYVLTTHAACEPNAELFARIKRIKDLYNCQLIANGLIPSLKYYLRMLSDPSSVLPKYVYLLSTDKAVKHEHREIWNTLVTKV